MAKKDAAPADNVKNFWKPGKKLLIQRQGIVYLCGRDYHFRPIIVVDIKKILDLEIKEK